MTDDLSKHQCEPCRVGAPRVSPEEQKILLESLEGWQVVDKKGVLQLLKAYDFDDFVGAIGFANRVGDLAETHDHHPALLVEWGRVTVRWWTHKIEGLHKSDFVMAAKTDQL